MRVPLGWLRDYVDLPDDIDAIVTKLAALGFPVETVERRPPISGVIVGRIAALTKHPNADTLQLCTVDVGRTAALTIATAAENVAAEQVVPVATIGAVLPKVTIGARKMRGIDSQGMLCSADELALPPEWFEDGIMQLDASLPIGTDVVSAFGLDRAVLEVEIGANRGDALSMVGIARELAAALDAPFHFPPLLDVVPDGSAGPAASDLRVTLESRDVRRYIAQRVAGVRVGISDALVRVRLALAGQRPISNLVDISNYVMLELGGPLHFFDYEKIAGKHIIVRDARAHERLMTLDGVDRELDPTALLIADDAQATGLAGLMGGHVSEVSDTTRAIVIESANFAGPRIRRMSLKLGLRTEASTRNEKNLPPALADTAAARAAYLLDRAGAQVYPPLVYGQPVSRPPTIALQPSDVARLLGFSVTPGAMQHALEALGFTVDAPDPDGAAGMLVTVPAWRSDVWIAADLVEEIARIIGYDRVIGELPPIAPQTLASTAFDRDMAIAHALVGLGYVECLTLALQPSTVAERWRTLGFEIPPVVEIRNPLSEDQRWMRFSLLPALLEHAARERRVRPLRTFELGHIFAERDDAPQEMNVVTLLATTARIAGQPSWRDAAYLAAAADVRALVRAVTGRDARLVRDAAAGFHPGKTARITADDTDIGFVGSIDPRLLRAHEIEDDAVGAVLFIDRLPAVQTRRHVALSRYPAVERDIAVVLDPAVSADEVVATIRAAAPLARTVAVFDEYRGPQIAAGKKSLAVRIGLQRDDATLTDPDADAALQRIMTALRAAHGATQRG